MKKLLFTASIFFLFINVGAQNVGIGTQTPYYKLSIHDDTHGYIGFTNDRTTQVTSAGSYIGAYQYDFYIGNKQKSGNMFFYTDAIRRLTLDSVGRFGIGKWPAEALDVKGAVRIESSTATGVAALKMYGGTSNMSYIQFYKNIYAPTAMGYIGFHPTLNAAIIQSGTTVSIGSKGMSVGSINSEARLQVPAGEDAGLSNTNNGFLMLGFGNATNVVMDNNEILARNNSAAADLFLQHSAGNLILCGNNQGAVSIGLSSGASIPTGYRLAVNGKVITEELKVQLSGNWPDYVFADHYNLKSFDHLRSFIAENKHLPNIPPAAEVEKNGIEVGDMQKRMMEKIEELTLYILELESRVKKLEQTNIN